AAQLEWLKADLDAAQARKQIIFVSLHHGAVSHASGPEAHGGSDLVRNQVVPELQQRHVAAMFAGHDHIYEHGCIAGVDYSVAGGTPDAGSSSAGNRGGATARACGTSGAATLMCLVPLLFVLRRRRATSC